MLPISYSKSNVRACVFEWFDVIIQEHCLQVVLIIFYYFDV